jgi:FAD/FMN-containing dehydrogenase
VSLGGTVSAEHGLGKRKAHLLALQYTPKQLDLMRAVKHRLDPQNILGRGTLFEPRELCRSRDFTYRQVRSGLGGATV